MTSTLHLWCCEADSKQIRDQVGASRKRGDPPVEVTVVRYGSMSNEERGAAYAPYTVMRTGPFEPMPDPKSAKKATLELVERMEEDVTFEDSTDPGRDL